MEKKKRTSALEKIDKQIAYLGNVDFDAAKFSSVRLLTTVVLLLLLYYFTEISYFVIPFLAIAYYYFLYYVIILLPIKRRCEKLEREALSFFEILTLSLESGRNLEKSLEITVSNFSSELSDEFKRALVEAKYGKSMVEALKDMKKRIPSETINNIILSITEASLFGSSLVDNMYSQIDFLRDKQMLSVREKINQIPNKISVISVLLMVPLMLLLILGPLVVECLG